MRHRCQDRAQKAVGGRYLHLKTWQGEVRGPSPYIDLTCLELRRRRQGRPGYFPPAGRQRRLRRVQHNANQNISPNHGPKQDTSLRPSHQYLKPRFLRQGLGLYLTFTQTPHKMVLAPYLLPLRKGFYPQLQHHHRHRIPHSQTLLHQRNLGHTPNPYCLPPSLDLLIAMHPHLCDFMIYRPPFPSTHDLCIHRRPATIWTTHKLEWLLYLFFALVFVLLNWTSLSNRDGAMETLYM